MNAIETKNAARNATTALLMGIFNANDAVQFDDAAWAILHVIEGQEIWTSIEVKSKAYKATKVSPAFDPYVAAEEWQERLAERGRKAAEKAAKKKEKEG